MRYGRRSHRSECTDHQTDRISRRPGESNPANLIAERDPWSDVMTMRIGVLSTLLLAASSLPLLADDWPQFRGPKRDGMSRETGLRKDWPKDGPPLLWTYSRAGLGYSGPAIVGDRLYMSGGRGDSEYVFALDL